MYKRNVLVSSIIIVGLLAAAPAVADKKRPVSVQENPRTPFQVEPPTAFGDRVATVEFIDEVPEGKRLITQYISIRLTNDNEVRADASCTLLVVRELEQEQDGVRLHVVTTREALQDLHIVSAAVTMYAEAGDRVEAKCFDFPRDLGEPEVEMAMVATLVGYLVDVKQHKDRDDDCDSDSDSDSD